MSDVDGIERERPLDLYILAAAYIRLNKRRGPVVRPVSVHLLAFEYEKSATDHVGPRCIGFLTRV